MQGLCSSTAGVGVHAAGSECKQWLCEDPCGAAQLDNRSVRGGPAVFARLLCLLVSYRPLATRGRRTFLWLSPALAPFSQLLPTKTVTRPH